MSRSGISLSMGHKPLIDFLTSYMFIGFVVSDWAKFGNIISWKIFILSMFSDLLVSYFLIICSYNLIVI